MAVSAVKTWTDELLTAADQNAEFANIYNNGEDLAWPATKAKDLDGQELILDANANTSIHANTDDRIDFRAGGVDIVRFDGTVASNTVFFDFVAATTGVAPVIKTRGESDIGFEFQNSDSEEMLTLASVATAVNELTIVNAATGNKPVVRTTGEADIGIEFQNSDSEQMLILASSATSVNEVTITSGATGVGPIIAATGETNSDLTLQSAGTGNVTADGVTVIPTLNAEVATTSGTAVSLSTTVPSWVTRITILFEGVSTDGTEEIFLQIGPTGGLETSSYVAMATILTTAVVTTSHTDAFPLTGQTLAAYALAGVVTLHLKDASNNTWVLEGNLTGGAGTSSMHVSAGVKSLAGTLTQLSLTTDGTPDDFDGGSVALVYE